MKFLFALVAVVSAAVDYEGRFKTFLNDFNKIYEGDEIGFRFNVFKNNVDAIEEHNAGNHSWNKGVNQFTDLTQAEFEAIYLGYIHRERDAVVEDVSEVPHADIDWRGKGAMTPVKDQGQCGSCWAFSTTGGIEGSYQLATGNLVSISEQQFVDCSKANSGCNGGLMDTAFEFAEGTAIATEGSYPYTARDGTCKSSFTTGVAKGAVTGYKDVANSASGLQSALNSN